MHSEVSGKLNSYLLALIILQIFAEIIHGPFVLSQGWYS